MKTNQLPTQEYLKEAFDYDPETGLLTWKERPQSHFPTIASYKSFNKRFIGKPAGTRHCEGYRAISLGASVRILVHRLIVKWVTGNDPHGYDIDHINGDRSDNRWENLRVVSRTQNSRNQKRRIGHNTTGYKGVHYYKARNKFTANIRINGKAKCIGYFETAEQAHEAYCAAAREHFGEYANFG